MYTVCREGVAGEGRVNARAGHWLGVYVSLAQQISRVRTSLYKMDMYNTSEAESCFSKQVSCSWASLRCAVSKLSSCAVGESNALVEELGIGSAREAHFRN